ncbi:archaetidylserine decarboxylase [Alicyclobacillus mengziensis]|uniref:Phosphatidylserine decarboxylase proenzyme n=1 Tax=Alicyclobacillus mengziensis TaxID=2931921 RepID=A0A9X7W378_9BACL|nr:archaetidylserine decarboxylase [Alicyclobacillus mengziensis]QSO49515.1 phosphatidylserine decarboxylase [Alicyclobacillus mengziensis]
MRRVALQQWERFWVRMLPKRFLTAFVGWFARRRISRYFIPWFIKAYEIDVTEAELPLYEYKTWVEFFSRRLRVGVRTISESGIISPVDGTASANGAILEGKLIQAKGQLYSVAALLGSDANADSFLGGQYVTLYLSPHDYHRVHMPFAGEITGWTHIPGSLYPVNPAGVRSVAGLFTKNERLVLHIRTQLGSFEMVLVGATIVGSIRTPFGPDYESPFRRSRRGIREGTVHVHLKKGAEVGLFEFGSTVILLFPRDMLLAVKLQEGQCVQMGQTIAEPSGYSPPQRYE